MTKIILCLLLAPAWGAGSLPSMAVVRERTGLPSSSREPVEMSVRAEESGFSSVGEPRLGIALDAWSSGGRGFKFQGRIGERRVEWTARRETRLEHGDRVEVLRIEGEGLDATLVPRAKGRHEYALEGTVTASFDPESTSEGMEYSVHGPRLGLRAKTRTAAGRTVVSGDYDAGSFDAASLAVVGVSVVLLRLDPPLVR